MQALPPPFSNILLHVRHEPRNEIESKQNEIKEAVLWWFNILTFLYDF